MSIEVGELDAWIESLSQCKQLPENDVKRLCDKVRRRLSSGELIVCCVGSGNSGRRVQRSARALSRYRTLLPPLASSHF